MTLEVSNLWKSLCAEQFANTDDAFLETFRRPGGANNRLAAWDPLDKTSRYFKFLLYTAAERQPPRFFELYRALGNVELGQPVDVKLRSCAINIDYFLSIDEFLFLESAMDVQSVRSIVEIGAGFGRTCHTLLALCDGGKLKQYTIIDLPQILALSRRALAKLVPEHFSKVRFIDATEESSWKELSADLAINIDSFQEMPPSTIDSYMRRVISNCGFFYVKNPIAKYDPQTIGLDGVDKEKLQDVLSLGYCREVIDIFDDAMLASTRPAYLEAYRPAGDWRLIADRPAEMFPYYHHAVYEGTEHEQAQ
jgi:putative sugar O-methyltransferase